MMYPEFYYDNRPAGAGKTHDQSVRIVESHGRYLFAVDRVGIMGERAETLARLSAESGTRVHICSIYASTPSRPDGVQSVRVAIEALPTTFRSGHVVILCTHQALKEADLSSFSEWHLIVDESPSWWDRTSLRTSTSANLVREMFELEPTDVGSRIVPNRRLTRRELHLDSLAAPLATLHARASRESDLVFTHIQSWDELARDSAWTWWALWSPRALLAFESVTILAAGFNRSLTLALARSQAPEIQWQPIDAPVTRPMCAPRVLTVHYFAEEHTASRYRFDSKEGRAALTKIALYLASRKIPRIWTCNSRDQPTFQQHLISGYLRPRQAGSNAYSHYHESAIIYTAKPDAYERQVLAKLGISPDLVTEARERDTIYQFVARTSLRDPSSIEPVTVFVYDRDQALALAAALATEPHLQVQLKLIDLGFAREEAARKNLLRFTCEERATRKREQAKTRKRNQRLRLRSEP